MVRCNCRRRSTWSSSALSQMASSCAYSSWLPPSPICRCSKFSKILFWRAWEPPAASLSFELAYRGSGPPTLLPLMAPSLALELRKLPFLCIMVGDFDSAFLCGECSSFWFRAGDGLQLVPMLLLGLCMCSVSFSISVSYLRLLAIESRWLSF